MRQLKLDPLAGTATAAARSMDSGNRKVVWAALIGNVLVAVTKFVASAYTGSASMLSEGVHSLVDSGNEVLLLYGMHRARLPANPQFPFGHGKELYFWSFVVALLVFALGAGVSLYEGVQHLRAPRAVEHSLTNYIVIALSMVFEGVSWYVGLKEFRAKKGRQPYLEAVRAAKDPTNFVTLVEDTAALLGLAIAAAGLALAQFTGEPAWDGVGSVLIGLVLTGTAALLARETKSLLIGESARPEVLTSIRRIALDIPEVDAVNEVLTMQLGPEYVLVNISLMISRHADRLRVHDVLDEIDHRIKARHPTVRRVFIESETELRPRAAATPSA